MLKIKRALNLIGAGLLNVGVESFIEAIKVGNRETVRLYIQQHANHPNALDIVLENGATPLTLATAKGDLSIVNDLLSAGANPELADSTGNTALHLAAAKGHRSIVKALLTTCKDLNLNPLNNAGHTPLYKATSSDHFDIMNDLLNEGANPNLTDKDGNSPLHLVSGSGQHQAVHDLIHKQANSNLADNAGNTPLHRAAATGRHYIAFTLIVSGANPNQKNRKGNTPIHLAVSNNDHETLHNIISSGKANLNALDSEGNTPLMRAAALGYLDIVKTLIENQVDLTIKNHKGLNAVELAEQHSQIEMSNVLRSAIKTQTGISYIETGLLSNATHPSVTQPDASITTWYQKNQESLLKDALQGNRLAQYAVDRTLHNLLQQSNTTNDTTLQNGIDQVMSFISQQSSKINELQNTLDELMQERQTMKTEIDRLNDRIRTLEEPSKTHQNREGEREDEDSGFLNETQWATAFTP